MTELIHQFGIDWRLLAAQAINFGALFFILYRFAYRPILGLLAERKKKIEEGMAMRQHAEEELRAAKETREGMIKETEREALKVLSNAEAAGKTRVDQALADAAEKSDEIIQEGKRRAQEEGRIMTESFAQEAEELVRKAVGNIAGKIDAVDRGLVKKALAEAKRIQ